jgi:hypothetical protein
MAATAGNLSRPEALAPEVPQHRTEQQVGDPIVVGNDGIHSHL